MMDEELEIKEIDEEIDDNDISVFLTANSRKELWDKIDDMWNDGHHQGKNSCYEYYNWNEEKQIYQSSIFEEENCASKCSICNKDLTEEKHIILSYEFYYWEDKKQWGRMQKVKIKNVYILLCKDCFIGN